MARIKKGDTVVVIAGKDKGKRSTVIQVHPTDASALVKDVAMITRHTKPRKQGEQGGIKHHESCIALCKLMPICGSCNKPCRINSKKLDEGGKRVRLCNKCKEIF
jgi:large subunit ribosomal protein L24